MAIRNSIEICKKCGDVVKNNIEKPDGVVIIIKVICEECKTKKEKKEK